MKKQIAIVAILLLGITVSVVLSQRQQILKSRASLQVYSAFNVGSNEPGKYVRCEGNVCETNTLNITISVRDLQALNIEDQQVASQCSWQSQPIRCTGCGVGSILEQDSCSQEIRAIADDVQTEECNLPEWCGSYVTQNTTERPPEQLPQPPASPQGEQGEPQQVCEEKSYCDDNLGLRVFRNTCKGTPVKEAEFDLECVPVEQVAINLKLRLEQDEQARIEAKKAETANIPQNVTNFVGGLPGGIWGGISSLWESQQQKPPEKNILEKMQDNGAILLKLAQSFGGQGKREQEIYNQKVTTECQTYLQSTYANGGVVFYQGDNPCAYLEGQKLKTAEEAAAEAEKVALENNDLKVGLTNLQINLDISEEKRNLTFCFSPLFCPSIEVGLPTDARVTIVDLMRKNQVVELAEKLDLDLSLAPNEWDPAKREYFFKVVARGDINPAKALAEFLVPVTTLENLQVSKSICEKKYQGNCIVSSDNILSIVNMSDQDIKQANEIARQLYPQLNPAPADKVREYAKILYSDSTINDQYLSDVAKAKYDREIVQSLGVSLEELLNIKNTFKVYGQVGDHIRNNTSEGKLLQQDQNTAALEGSIAVVTSLPAADLAIEGLVFGVRKVTPKLLSVLIRDYGDDAAKKIVKNVEDVAERGGRSMSAAEAASIKRAEAALVESSGDDLALATTPAGSLDNLVRGGGLDNDAAAALRTIRDDPKLDETAAKGLEQARSGTNSLDNTVVVIIDPDDAKFVAPDAPTGNPFQTVADGTADLADNVTDAVGNLLVKQGDDLTLGASEQLQNPILAAISDKQVPKVLEGAGKLSGKEVRRLADNKIIVTDIADQVQEIAQRGDLQQAWEYAHGQVSRQVRSLVTEGEVDSRILSQITDEKTAEALGMKIFYHYTSEKSVAGIAKDGILKSSKSGLAGKGVYVTDLGPSEVEPIGLIDNVIATYAFTNPFGITKKVGIPKKSMTDYFVIYAPEETFSPTWMSNTRYMRAFKAGEDLATADPRVVVKGPFKREGGEKTAGAGKESLDDVASALTETEARLIPCPVLSFNLVPVALAQGSSISPCPIPNPAVEMLQDAKNGVVSLADQAGKILKGEEELTVWQAAGRDIGVQPQIPLTPKTAFGQLDSADLEAAIIALKKGNTDASITELTELSARYRDLLDGYKNPARGARPIDPEIIKNLEQASERVQVALNEAYDVKLGISRSDEAARGDLTVYHGIDNLEGVKQHGLAASSVVDVPGKESGSVVAFGQGLYVTPDFSYANIFTYDSPTGAVAKITLHDVDRIPVIDGDELYASLISRGDEFVREMDRVIAERSGNAPVVMIGHPGTNYREIIIRDRAVLEKADITLVHPPTLDPLPETITINGESFRDLEEIVRLAPCPIFSLIPIAYAQGLTPCPKGPLAALARNAGNVGRQARDAVSGWVDNFKGVFQKGGKEEGLLFPTKSNLTFEERYLVERAEGVSKITPDDISLLDKVAKQVAEQSDQFDFIVITGGSRDVSSALLRKQGVDPKKIIEFDEYLNQIVYKDFNEFPNLPQEMTSNQRIQIIRDALVSKGVSLDSSYKPRILIVDDVVHSGGKAVEYLRKFGMIEGVGEYKFAVFASQFDDPDMIGNPGIWKLSPEESQKFPQLIFMPTGLTSDEEVKVYFLLSDLANTVSVKNNKNLYTDVSDDVLAGVSKAADIGLEKINPKLKAKTLFEQARDTVQNWFNGIFNAGKKQSLSLDLAVV